MTDYPEMPEITLLRSYAEQHGIEVGDRVRVTLVDYDGAYDFYTVKLVDSFDDDRDDDMPACCKPGGRPCGNDFCRCMQ